jgi:uncharacterized protein YodC (DUF2158 family)
MAQLARGSKVRLKSGSLLMTVKTGDTDGFTSTLLARCVWFEKGKPREKDFPGRATRRIGR